ncbi:DUF445 domain-containing protein [Aristophania vespae]|uniref:DUF445 domain-containing protein n=1 Tax=Aristophania vespae TaxID=2697033 RepID=UPI0023511DEC|nr:DUF445 domain-containing protein [Aristophania vespae]UMM63397.1 hypothetical protein DM15PD_03590 [Aristophania vespae]
MMAENGQEKVRKCTPSFLATSLLVGMGSVAVAASLPIWRRLYGQNLALDVIQAGSRAGLVGGIADWFAVTALFRHPLGLPIPHTAILPRKKEQIGEALGRFIAEHFFSEKDVAAALQRFDFAKLLSQSLNDAENFSSISQQLRVIIPSLLTRLSDGRGATFLARVLDVFIKRDDIAPLIIRILKVMVDGDIHQEVFSFILVQFREMVMTRETELRDFVEARVREQGGRLVGWAIGSSVANQVLHALKVELERVDPMDSDLRHSFTSWIRGKISELEKDPDQAQKLIVKLRTFFTHESLRVWAGSLWVRLRDMVEEDSSRPDGWSAQSFDALLCQMIEALETQAGLATKLNQTIDAVILGLLPSIRREISTLIPRVVNNWDGPTLSARIENGVGQDLAFIRINGTIVGFFIGAILEIILNLIGYL